MSKRQIVVSREVARAISQELPEVMRRFLAKQDAIPKPVEHA